MANSAINFEAISHVPIAQLSPSLAEPSTRSVKAIVTLTWPYSSAADSVAFLLAEPDFRLRRSRGQVRAQFSGSSAKAVAKSGIASGDEVVLSLDGVEWIQDEVPFATPGRGIEFDLKFTERLLLQFRQEGSQETNLIDIDHPPPVTEAPARIGITEIASSTYANTNSTSVSTHASPLMNNGEEWSSPAFIKRARTSYGSLYGKEYDIFAEEDGTVQGKGRKRTRLSSRLSSTWRYESRSPSPEAEEEHTMNTSPMPEPRVKPIMADEGSQTIGLEEGDAAEILAEFRKQATNVGNDTYKPPNGARTQDPAKLPIEMHDEPHGEELPVEQTQPIFEDTTKTQHDIRYASPPSQLPSSPRPQVIPSDALPLVSPLVTNNLGTFLETRSTERMSEEDSELLTFAKEPTKIGDDLPQDLYAASPVAIQSQLVSADLNGFHEPSGVSNSDETPNVTNHFVSEDQYGKWQSMIGQENDNTSQPAAGESMTGKEPQDDFLLHQSREVFDFPPVGFQVSESGVQHHYPDPEDEYGQQGSSLWGTESKRVSYPDLPGDEELLNTGRFMQAPLDPRVAAMSRSGSARSTPVDLTESSDGEEDTEENEDRIPVDGLVDEEEYERSDIEGDVEDGESNSIHGASKSYRSLREESFQDEEADSMDVDPVRDHSLRYDQSSDDEDNSQYSRDEQEPRREDYGDTSEENNDDRYRIHQQGIHAAQEEDFEDFNDEDEGSFDEDMDDDEQVQQEPVVIDLLSSDEEDEGEPDAPNPETVTSSRPTDFVSPGSSEGEDSDPDENMIMEDMPQDPMPESRNESTLPTVHQNEEIDEDAHFDTEGDDESIESGRDAQLPDTEDEIKDKEDGEDVASADTNGIEDPSSLKQGAVMMANDEGLDDNEGDKAEEDEHNEVIEDKDDEEVTKEVELEKPQEDTPHEKLGSQETGEHRDNHDSGENFGNLNSANIDLLSEELKTQSPTQHILISSLDGSNDERSTSLYPILPTSKVAFDLLSGPSFHDAPADSGPSTETNGQLPTPADTQLSLIKESSDISVSSLTSDTKVLKSVSDQLVINSAIEAKPQIPNENIVDAVEDAVHVEAAAKVTDVIEVETADISAEQIIEKASSEKEVELVVEAHNTRSRTRQQNGHEPVTQEEAQTVEKAINDSPRRSHRRGKSSSSVSETPQAKGLTTPPKPASKVTEDESLSAQTPRSSAIVLDEKMTPQGQDVSIQLAMAALDSPTKQPHDLRSSQPSMDMKLKLTRALRTELSEFTSLKVLKFKLTQSLDVLGVVTTVPPEPERAKSGPRHYQITFNITDHSIAPGGPHFIEVQVFRPYKDALPVVKVGDGILLRDFQVISLKKSGFGLRSIDSSSWAVFKDDNEEVVDVRGPPVEYGHGERKQMGLLRSWYRDLDSTAIEKINRANGTHRATSTGKSIGKVV